jgi:phosphoenolpyruvate-protein kinase (PTS system EI component)
LGLGVDEFSMIAPRIPYAKEFIRQLYMSKALAQANRLI